jgi:hypothetical protein
MLLRYRSLKSELGRERKPSPKVAEVTINVLLTAECNQN